MFFLQPLRFLFVLVCLTNSFPIFAQKEKVLDDAVVDPDFQNKYNTTLRRMRRVYPLAIEAARLVHELDAELAHAESKRQKRKITKT